MVRRVSRARRSPYSFLVSSYLRGTAVMPFALFKMPKSRKGRRWVPLAPPAQRALARHRKAQQAEREFLGIDYDDHDLVFCRPDGLPLRPDRVTVAFEGHVAGCGLPVIRLHDTRHGACSLMLAGGVPIEIVQMILGHSSPEITRRVYAHLMRKTAAEQVGKASKLLTRHRPDRDAVRAIREQRPGRKAAGRGRT